MPEMNPFSKESEYEHLCRFRKSTARRILDLVPPAHERESDSGKANVLFTQVRPKLPPGIFSVHNIALFKAAGSRLNTIADHIRHCLSNYSESDVLFF